MANGEEAAAVEGEGTGLPVLRTWGRVYAFVLAAFGVMVGLLVWLTRAYS